MDSILITGASGFIGSFIVEEALKRGFSVWAAVRKNSPRHYLQDSRLNFIELDLDNEQHLTEQLAGHDFKYVIHAAGVTKCLNAEDFHRVNTLGTVNIVNALKATSPSLSRFVFISSLSVFGPVREEQPYQDIKDTDTRCPNTLYGRSKAEAEDFLATQTDFPWIGLRLTGVYGPREKDYYMMFKSIRKGFDFAVGYKPQAITFVFVSDVVQAAMLALERGKIHKLYFISDGQVYSSRTFSDLVRKQVEPRFLLRIKAPLSFLRMITSIGQFVGQHTGKMPVLNKDKYHILSQRNWRCDITPAREELGYEPHVMLEYGVLETACWYYDNDWL